MNTSMNAKDSSRLVEARQWHMAGKLDDARPVYRRLLRKYPTNSDVQSLLAALLLDTGKPVDALPFLRRLVKERSGDADIQYNLGLALSESGDHEAALVAYRTALELAPDHPLAWYNSGLAQRRLGHAAEAIAAFEHDFQLRPRLDSARLLSKIHEEEGNRDRSLFYANRCVELDGAQPADLHRLVALEARHLAESMFIGDQQALDIETLAVHAAQLSPDDPEALTNLGMIYSQLGDHLGALPPLQHALALDPGNDRCRELLAILLMTVGRIEEGWRLRTRHGHVSHGLDLQFMPRWQGRMRPGLRLVVLWEQGIGDQILYAHMLGDLVASGVDVTLLCDPRLVALFNTSTLGVHATATLTPADLQAHDAYTSLGELHIWLRPTPESVPAPSSYLRADATRVAAFRNDWATRYPGKRFIGLSWQSHSGLNGAGKSIPLTAMAPILALPDSVFICTQYGEGAVELQSHAAARGIQVHVDDTCNALTDMDVAAAQLMALDELVSVSNASVHLAGALGVRAHVLLGRRPVWHWFATGDRSIWYPHVYLYRQVHLDSWDEPIRTLAERLKKP